MFFKKSFPLDHEPNKKRAHVSLFVIFGFFSIVNKFKINDVTQMGFVEDMMLFMVKGFLLMKNVESIWLQRLAYMLSPCTVFPSKKTSLEDILLGLVGKTMSTYVQPSFVDYLLTTRTFDLWMGK